MSKFLQTKNEVRDVKVYIQLGLKHDENIEAPTMSLALYIFSAHDTINSLEHYK